MFGHWFFNTAFITEPSPLEHANVEWTPISRESLDGVALEWKSNGGKADAIRESWNGANKPMFMQQMPDEL